MPKDLKIGLAIGLGIVMIAVIWLSTRPSLTPQARLASAPPRRANFQPLHNTDTQQETSARTDTQYATNENPEFKIDRPVSDIQEPETIPQSLVPSIEQPEPNIQSEQTERFYIVRKNDTLSSISQQYYGTATKWPKIFAANRDTIPDANKLPIGTKLIIPDESD